MLEPWRVYYGIVEDEPRETTRAKISDRLLGVDESYRADQPFFFDLLANGLRLWPPHMTASNARAPSLAQMLLATDGDPPRAVIETALDRAEALVTSIEGRSLSPRTLELRGRVAVALGDAPAANQALRESLVLYRTIGATGHPIA